MCSTPDIPKPPPPPQPVKPPDIANVQASAKKNRTSSAMGGGSLLTGPGGLVAPATGKTTLLGG